MSDLFTALARVLGLKVAEVEDDDEFFQMLPDSEAIQEAIYDPDTKSLTIEFVTGGQYIYDDVSRQRFAAFKNSASKGRYFVHRIRENYAYSRI